MRILTVSHFFEHHGGGIERVAGHLCRHFTRLGSEAVWAASDCDPEPNVDIEAVPLHCVNPTERLTGLPMPVPGPSAIRALAREVKHCDAVVVHDALYVTSIVALLLAKAYNKRVILIQHIAAIPFSSPALRGLMKLANRLVTRPMLWMADARVFISDTVRHDLLGTPARWPYHLLFNGVDSEVFHSARTTPPPIPSAMAGTHIPAGAGRILFVGRYVEKKGLNVLRALAQARPDLSIFLAGAGPIRPADWGLANVHDLGTRRPEELAELYRWADLLVLPSVGEGYPLVIQEAMACGLPVVCGEPSNLADPGVSQWIRGVRIDLAEPAASAQRCAQAIDDAMQRSVDRAAMARQVAERYSWEAMARGVLALTRAPRDGIWEGSLTNSRATQEVAQPIR